jgi:hypothetical protein
MVYIQTRLLQLKVVMLAWHTVTLILMVVGA